MGDRNVLRDLITSDNDSRKATMKGRDPSRFTGWFTMTKRTVVDGQDSCRWTGQSVDLRCGEERKIEPAGSVGEERQGEAA